MNVLTEPAKKWLQDNSKRKLKHFRLEGDDEDIIFIGDFYHKGVDLTAGEVHQIMAEQVFGDAQAWAARQNEDPDGVTFKFAGIEWIGPVDGQWWEDKGKNPSPPRGDGKRYHKFGGNGKAYIWTY